MIFFVGPPGVGKTSMSRLLAESQNIKQRFHEIPVARGWTSVKDLIGFFNPLAGRFQAANTGLAGFFKDLHKEKEDSVDSAMAYVLLDEANLSPIEHYWATFMAMTDGEKTPFRIGEDDFSVPDCMRFLATINYDGTTEPLSPRMIDRAPIILMEESSMEGECTVEESIADILPVSWNTMEELFGKKERHPSLNEGEKKAFDAVRYVLNKSDGPFGRPIQISRRKEIAIQHFCERGRTLMNSENQLTALDYAIKQHVLPQVRGHGKPFKKRLDELSKVLSDYHLDNSYYILDRMITYGTEDLDSYDFFCW
ncbi:MAG: AAA family ATPase [Magnetococcales bacterium]|nr:AAA family ATPase [Magnetococcales bacterium]